MKKYRKSKLHALDEIDKGLIKELQIDARQSYLSLGKKIGASEGTIRNRINSQLKGDVIQLKAVINPSKIGYDFSCVIGLEINIDKLRETAELLAKNPNVCLLVGCTGVFDLIAMLIFPNTSYFEKFMGETIAKLPGIKRTQTFVIMSQIKTPWSDNLDIFELRKT